MKIHSIREGFATNSSSTHSLLLLAPNESGPLDYLVEEGSFGWENFRAASPEAKKIYLAALLSANMDRDSNEEIVKAVVRQELGIEHNSQWGIDHQSVYALPRDWEGQGVDLEFFRELKDYILSPRIVILGGNDNNDGRSDWDSTFVLPIVQDTDPRCWVGRKDPLGYWVLFDRKHGTKIRVSFTHGKEFPKVQRASYPELVDIKITDLCPHNCSICYQGSTANGQHALKASLGSVAYALEVGHVFEAAIGGGEPTLHPDFFEWIQTLRRRGVVPNFTTRNTQWLGNGELAKRVSETCGGVAFSIDTAGEIGKICRAANQTDFPREKLSVQYVVGVPGRSPWELGAIMYDCYKECLRLTLLGFKSTGRARGVQPVKEDWLKVWCDFCKRHETPTLSIDTMLAKGAEADLEKAGVPKWCYETQEGRFSCYIDAVEERFGPSSYCADDMYRPLGNDPQQAIREAMAKWVEANI